MIIEKIANSTGFTCKCKCDWCGKKFSRSSSNVAKKKNHFCNRVCWGKWNSHNNSGEKSFMYGRCLLQGTRKKLSKLHKGQIPWNKDKKDIYSTETRKKMGRSMRGKKHSEETKKKMSEAQSGEKNYAWKGGRISDGRGYIMIRKPEHPSANNRGYVFEHRIVMEEIAGRYLKPDEIVHHINEITDDNRPENLMLCKNLSEHRKEHKKFKKQKTKVS